MGDGIIKKLNLIKTINVLTLILFMLILLAGLARTLISPDDEIFYENRPAEKIISLTPESYLDKSFQGSVESALSDQVNFAIKMKKLYNIFDTSFALPVISKLQSISDNYIGFRDIFFYNEMLVVKPVPFSAKVSALDNTVKSINNYIRSSEATDFFIYYIETDKDINFSTNEKSGFYEYIKGAVKLPDDHISRLSVSSYEDYRKNFLCTDHHWNGNGAYSAYVDICNILGTVPLKSNGTHTISGRYLGTRAAGVEGVNPEAFSVNIFDFPAMNIIMNDSPAEEYGLQTEFINNELSEFSYGTVFGPDCREIIFDTGKDGDRLLIMGDSYDNAIIKALASGFSKTYCVDLRAHDAHSFDLINYIEEKQIDSVLFIGGIDYFSTILY